MKQQLFFVQGLNSAYLGASKFHLENCFKLRDDVPARIELVT